jgi:hypothetical protein
MASHPYIAGAGNLTQMIGFLRKNFPATVNSDTVKKFGLAPKNESYVINALQFIGVIDEEGKRTIVDVRSWPRMRMKHSRKPLKA